jgi:hypothetical protein
MFNANNPRHKLNASQIEEARKRYEDCGWKILWIARFFGIDCRAIRFHAGNNGWVRRAGMAKYMPDEIAEIYRERRKDRYLKKEKGSYEYIQMSAQERKRQSCEHHRWIKRCSICNEIIGSDAADHNH